MTRPELDLDALERIDPSTMDLSPTPRPAALEFLLSRRSTPARTLGGPAPSDRELRLMLKAAVRSPDHGKLTPWRFLIVRRDGQERLASAAELRARETGLDEAAAQKARQSFLDGAMIVVVIAAPHADAKFPEIEQYLSGAAVAASLLNAALAMGYGANWLTGWAAHDALFRKGPLGLAEHERVIAFIHLGTPSAPPQERPRPDLETLISEL